MPCQDTKITDEVFCLSCHIRARGGDVDFFGRPTEMRGKGWESRAKQYAVIFEEEIEQVMPSFDGALDEGMVRTKPFMQFLSNGAGMGIEDEFGCSDSCPSRLVGVKVTSSGWTARKHVKDGVEQALLNQVNVVHREGDGFERVVVQQGGWVSIVVVIDGPEGGEGCSVGVHVPLAPEPPDLLPVGGDVPNRFEQNGFGQVVQVNADFHDRGTQRNSCVMCVRGNRMGLAFLGCGTLRPYLQGSTRPAFVWPDLLQDLGGSNWSGGGSHGIWHGARTVGPG